MVLGCIDDISERSEPSTSPGFTCGIPCLLQDSNAYSDVSFFARGPRDHGEPGVLGEGRVAGEGGRENFRRSGCGFVRSAGKLWDLKEVVFFFLDDIGAIAELEGQPSKFCNECVLQMFATLNWKKMTFLR